MYNDCNVEIIGIDHGFGNMKTRNTVFKSGVKTFDEKPPFGTEILQYKDKFYLIGEGHKTFIAEKDGDEDYFILTLTALAKELKERGKSEAQVILAVGLPISWLKAQKENFKQYLMKETVVEFKFKNEPYRVRINDVLVFPQGYAGVSGNMTQFEGTNMLADIGNGTMNTVFINNHKPRADKYYTDKLGVNQCVIQIRNSLLAECGSVPDDELIEQFLITGTADMPEKYLKVMRDEAYKYVKSIFEKLSEYEYNPDLVKLYFIGGGGCLIKNFGEYDPERVEIISDICATAKGYESLAKAVMKNA